MNRRQFLHTAAGLAIAATAGCCSHTRSQAKPPPFAGLDPQPLEIPLWPDAQPLERGSVEAERDTTKPEENLVAGRAVIRLGHVARPTLTIYRPPASQATGTTVLVCPGGGYYILAWDLEGTEVCQWLNQLGITAALLKYRVPRLSQGPKHTLALPDAQRALRVLRHRAGELGLRRDHIGMLGFSAGAHLSATLSTGIPRSYPALDAADHETGDIAFQMLIYPGGLATDLPGRPLAPEVTPTANSPKTFIVITQDDGERGGDALTYTAACQRAGVPTTLHFYPSGGHGYGLRRTADLVTHWPERAADWLRADGWTK